MLLGPGAEGTAAAAALTPQLKRVAALNAVVFTTRNVATPICPLCPPFNCAGVPEVMANEEPFGWNVVSMLIGVLPTRPAAAIGVKVVCRDPWDKSK